MPWKNKSPICGEKAGSAGLALPREAVGRFNESYPHGLFPVFKEVRRQLALSQEDLPRAQLDAFCERMQKEGFLVLPPEQDSI